MSQPIVGVPRSVPAVAGATRAAVIVAGVLAVFYFGLSPGAPPSARDRWAALQNRWDTGFYVGIASGGYRHAGTPTHFDDVAFFPAFPLVLRATALVFRVPRTPNAWAWTGALVSCALFILACGFMYRVASQQTRGDPFGAVLFCALYPFALFFSASYTESLFLLCCLASYDYMLRSRPLPAACWGLVAGLTRPPGWLLSIVLVDALIRTAQHRRSVLPVVAALAPVAGAFLFASYLTWLTGDPFAWTAAQAKWGRHYEGIGEIARSLSQRIGEHGFLRFAAMWPVDLMNAFAALLALGSVVPVWRRQGASQALFVGTTIGLPLLFGGLTSLARFSSVLFPLFLWFSSTIRGTWRIVVLTAFAITQLVAAAMFYTWRPLF